MHSNVIIHDLVPRLSCPGLGAIARFFIPLALTQGLMATTHWIINIGLTRTTTAELTLASYAVGLSIISLFENPATMFRAISVALVRTRSDYRIVLRATYLILSILVGVPVLLICTPALSAILRDILRVAPEVIDPAVGVFRILIILPLVSGLRCLFQGLLIYERSTGYITVGMLVRVVAMVVLIIILVTVVPHWGGVVGALTFLIGMSVEATIAFACSRRTKVLQPNHSTDLASAFTFQKVLRFAAPILATTAVSTFSRMFLNAGLAQPDTGPGVLAAFSLGWSLIWVVAAPCILMHQVVLVFGETDGVHGRAAIRRFMSYAVGIQILLIALLSMTPLTNWILAGVMGTPSRLIHGTTLAMRWLLLLPLLLAWQEHNIGQIILRRRTKLLLIGKVLNVVMVLLALGPGRHMLLALGPAAGSVATLLGHLFEAVILFIISYTITRQRKLASPIQMTAE